VVNSITARRGSASAICVRRRVGTDARNRQSQLPGAPSSWLPSLPRTAFSMSGRKSTRLVFGPIPITAKRMIFASAGRALRMSPSAASTCW